MKTVIAVVLILVAYLLGRSAGFYSYQRFLRKEYPDVLYALMREMDERWEYDDENIW